MIFQGTEFKPGDTVHLNPEAQSNYRSFSRSFAELCDGVTVTDVARADEWYVFYRPNEGVYFKYIEHMGGPW